MGATTSGDGPPYLIEDPDTVVDAHALIDDDATLAAEPLEVGAELAVADGSISAEQLAARVGEASHLVDFLARVVSRATGYREAAELASVGREALVDAARAYDRARGRFEAFAAQRMRWKMIDHVRREGRHRGTRRRAHALAASEVVASAIGDEPTSGALPTEEAAQGALATALARHAEALVVGLVLGGAGPDALPDSGPDPERAVVELRAREVLHAAVAALPERQRTIVERHYFHEERFDHIAESLGVSKSWASRLHAQALIDLGRALRRR